MKQFFIYPIFLLGQYFVFGQVREQEMNEIVVSKHKDTTLSKLVQEIDKEQLTDGQPTDVGDALLNFNGISLKNYGGIGGLKTFNFRGIGGAHTVAVLDGFLLTNPQTGQVNLGNQMIQNLNSIRFGKVSGYELMPASAYIFSSVLSMTSVSTNSLDSNLSVDASFSAGSFALFDGYIQVLKPYSKGSITAYFRKRNFEGKYPFVINYGDFSLSGIRNHNQLTDNSIGLKWKMNTSKGSNFNILFNRDASSQNLPGAVVLFNPSVGQYLDLEQNRLSFDCLPNWKKARVRVFNTFQHNYLHYQDSTFLNKGKFLESKFLSLQSTFGISSQFQIYRQHQLYFNNDLDINFLENLRNDDTKVRQVFTTVLGIEKNQETRSYQFQIGYQRVLNESFSIAKRDLLSYSATYSGKFPNSTKLSYNLMSGYSNRLPSFSELYFGSIENISLKVEKAFQNQIGASFSKKKGNAAFDLNGSFYYNRVFDKLVAIPTKNLFVWSILNVGIVDIFGNDLTASWFHRLGNSGKWNLNLGIKYAYQLALDKTSKESPVYGHQIAYIPFNTIQSNFGVQRKGAKLFAELFWSDYRYSLNQNILANVLPSFFFIDLGLSQKFMVKEKHLFTIQVNVKNITNENFVFVRSYPMPGRNFLITLRYAV